MSFLHFQFYFKVFMYVSYSIADYFLIIAFVTFGENGKNYTVNNTCAGHFIGI